MTVFGCLVMRAAPVTADDSPPPYPTIACLAALADKPELQAIQRKVALVDANAQTLEMLANDAKPTKVEKPVIATWIDEQTDCVKSGDSWRAAYLPPTVSALMDEFFTEYKATAADLYGGKISYGQFAKARAAYLAKFKSDLAVLVQQLKAQQAATQQAREQEQERRQELAAQQQHDEQMQAAQIEAEQEQADRARRFAAMMYMMQRPAPQVQFHPIPVQPTVTTNCNSYGAGGFSCTSH